MVLAPYINRRIQKTKRYKHRICPYSTCDQTNRIPANEKTNHIITSGYMALDIRGGHDRLGYRCDDPNCSYYLGTASTPIIIGVRKMTLDRVTGKYDVIIENQEVPIGCSGIKFWET